jgi:hypothetical protein
MGLEGVDWIHLAQDTDLWWALVNALMNIRVPRWSSKLWRLVHLQVGTLVPPRPPSPYKSTRRRNPEDHYEHLHRSENLESQPSGSIKGRGISWLAKRLSSSQEGLCFTKLVKVKVSRYTPWRRMGERRYTSYSYLTSAIRWWWVVSLTSRPRFTPGERTPGTHCIGGWVGLRAGLSITRSSSA